VRQARVGALTLFAFSSENWQRPTIEVNSLMQLFLEAMDREIDDLHKNKVRLRSSAIATPSASSCRRAWRPVKS